jgi:transglutaminase-like putative cysteine protease
MRLTIDVELDYQFPAPADVLLGVEAAQMADQRLVEDLLTVGGAGPLRPIPGEEGIGQRTWLNAQGRFEARYRAVVEVDRPPVALEGLAAVPARDLPATVVPYLWPSRYCESDRFEAFIERRFGDLDGGAKVVAMADWIRAEVDYVAGSSDVTTTAVDSFVSRRGVCRDYAHLMASFARAAGIPARSARFPCGGRGLARRRLAPGRRHPPGAAGGPGPDRGRPRRDRHRLHDHLRRGDHAAPERPGDPRRHVRAPEVIRFRPTLRLPRPRPTSPSCSTP